MVRAIITIKCSECANIFKAWDIEYRCSINRVLKDVQNVTV